MAVKSISVDKRKGTVAGTKQACTLQKWYQNGAIVSGYIVVSSGRSPYVATDGGFEFEDWNDYECDMWMPIPSFNDILEANRDVLERIKEKGD